MSHEPITPTRKNWSLEEVEELKAKVEKRGKITIKGRTEASISKKIYDLGLKPRYMEVRKKGKSNTAWSEEEIAMIQKGIKRIKGRSRCAVMGMRRRLGIKITRDPRPPYWSGDNEKLLKSLHEKGMSARDIARAGCFQGKTSMSIQKKLCRMGLAKKKSIKALPKKMRKTFLAFLSENCRSLTLKEMTDRWNTENPKHKVNNRRVRKGLGEIGFKVKFSIPKKVRKKLQRFIVSGWACSLTIHQKSERISERWNLTNTNYQISPKRVRLIAGDLQLIKKKMSDLDRLRLKKFLSEKWEGKTPGELVSIWNAASSSKTNILQVSKMLRDMNLKVDCSEIEKINLLRKQEKELFESGAACSKLFEEKIRANRIEIMRSRFEQNKGIFTGLKLGEDVLAETL